LAVAAGCGVVNRARGSGSRVKPLGALQAEIETVRVYASFVATTQHYLWIRHTPPKRLPFAKSLMQTDRMI
jgi:hypothetical protein